ncbi:MAG TPA: TonB-dependent receptor [candidate division Zixibacteria bacterium]|jgi:outer membrane receptor protein involved in Fe transport
MTAPAYASALFLTLCAAPAAPRAAHADSADSNRVAIAVAAAHPIATANSRDSSLLLPVASVDNPVSLGPPVILPPIQVEGVRTHPDVVRRIEPTRMQKSTARTLADMLQTIPGVRAYGTAETPGGIRVSVGGEPPHRVAILLDGLPLSGGPDGSVDVSTISPEAIAAIEVRPGAQSAVVGDAGVGGSVNFITRETATLPRLQISAIRGEDESDGESMTVRWDASGIDAAVTAERLKHGPRFEYPSGDSTAVRNDIRRDVVRGFTHVGIGERSALRLAAFHYDADHDAPGELENATPGATNADRRTRIQSVWESQAPLVQRVSAGFWWESTREEYEFAPATRGIPEHATLRERFLGSRVALEPRLLPIPVDLSGEVRHRSLHGVNHLRPALSFGSHARTEGAVRGGVHVSRHTFLGELSAALRGAGDFSDDAPPVVTSGISLSLAPVAGVQIRGGWGESFRRPLLTALHWKADAWTVGNPGLRPERAAEWNIGGGWSRGPLSVDTRYFERDVRDIIVWDKRGVPARYTPINVDRALIIGREDHARLSILRDMISLEYAHSVNGSYDKSGDRNYSDKELVFTPRHVHHASIRGVLGRVALEGHGLWTGRRAILRFNSKWLPAERSFDVLAAVDLRRRVPTVVARARIDNLTNERLEPLPGYPSPGRTWTLGVTVGL